MGLVTVLFKRNNSIWHLLYLIDDGSLTDGGHEKTTITKSKSVNFLIKFIPLKANLEYKVPEIMYIFISYPP